MNISLMVRFDKNWELENGKSCLINTVGHVAPSSCVISRCRCIHYQPYLLCEVVGKWLSQKHGQFVKKYFFSVKLLHAHLHYVCNISAKC